MIWTHTQDMSARVEAYLRCALWTWVDEEGNSPFPGDEGSVNVLEVFDLPSLINAVTACRDFCEQVDEWSEDLPQGPLFDMEPEQAGHDFWLTREGHGAGFWDRGLGRAGDVLTKAAKAFGECYLDIENGKATLDY